jgi:hypothetical protein
MLIAHGGWRSVYFVFLGVMAFIVAPLYAFALPRNAVYVPPPVADGVPPVKVATIVPASGALFLLMVAGFAAHVKKPGTGSGFCLVASGKPMLRMAP